MGPKSRPWAGITTSKTKCVSSFKPSASRPWWCPHLERENRRTPAHGARRGQCGRHAHGWESRNLAAPLSQPDAERVNHRGHRRLALLNSSRLRFLNRARLISFSEVGPTCRAWFRQSLAKRPAAASRSARLNRDLLLDSENSR